MPLSTSALSASKHLTGMPQPARYIYQQAYESQIAQGKSERTARNFALKELSNTGWQQARFGWVAKLQSPQMVRVRDVKVFAAGTWVDSMGNVREWTIADLDGMVAAFQASVPNMVPLKAGHTTDEFNVQVAEALGVPVELLVGENGRGAISLGRMIELTRQDEMLYAQFEGVPEPIARLIEGGLYRTISSEIEDGISGFTHAITGVAMLGAEEPAIESTTLDKAKVFGGPRTGAAVYSFLMGETPKDVLEKEFTDLSEQIDEAADKKQGAPMFKSLLKLFGALFKQIVGKGGNPQPDATKDVAPQDDVEKDVEEAAEGEAPDDAPDVAKDDVKKQEAGLHQDDVPDTVSIAKALGLEGKTDKVYLVWRGNYTDTGISWSVATDFGTADEQMNQYSVSVYEAPTSTGQIIDTDISAAFSGLTGGDYIGIKITANLVEDCGNYCYGYLLGVRLKYGV